MINNFIAYYGASDIRGLKVFSIKTEISIMLPYEELTFPGHDGISQVTAGIILQHQTFAM